MKIAILSSYDLNDINLWSGTPYHICQELLKENIEVHQVKPDRHSYVRIIAKIIKRISYFFGVKNFELARTKIYCRIISKEIDEKLNKINPDIIVGIAASIELYLVDTDIPVIHISDTTFSAMVDYNPEFSQMPDWLRCQGEAIEASVIEKSRAAVYSSRWASDSAVGDYGASVDKVHTLPFGANVQFIPTITDSYLAEKFDGKCRILFVGKDWKYKGGDIVLAAVERLRNSGLDIELSIVGSRPDRKSLPPGVSVYENLDKSDPDQFQQFNDLFSTASIFVLPTQAEAYGLVFAEAAAFATPVIAPATGGVPTVVPDGETGVLVPTDAGEDRYAAEILELWNDKARMKSMAIEARSRFDEVLNWDAWGREFFKIVESCVSSSSILPAKKIRIALFGAAHDTSNMGVSALFISTVAGLKKLLPAAEFIVFDNGLGLREITHKLAGKETVTLTHFGARAGKQFQRPENLATMMVAARLGRLGKYLNKAVSLIDSCDVVLDISGGDSFSDIYGRKRFLSVVRPKLIALKRRKPLILLPQTFGPYKDSGLRRMAVKAVGEADMVWARDEHSLVIARDLLGDNFDPAIHLSGVDVAFGLPARSSEELIGETISRLLARKDFSGPLVGLNVSGLVYNSPEAAARQYGFRADYREVVHKFLTWLLEQSDSRVILIPHVLPPSGSLESDHDASFAAISAIEPRFADRVAVSGRDLDQSEIKWLISKMDWFCGTRMHSTIAGLSSGVPTASIAYSDKTKGVFETCGQGRHVIDPRVLETDEVIEGLKLSFNERKATRQELAKFIPGVKQRAEGQIATLATKILELGGHNQMADQQK